MKNKVYGALMVLIVVIFSLTVAASTKGAPNLVYVYSDSMEPLIHVNDAFIVWPVSQFKIGDIVVYRPVVLDAPYITHRVIANGDKGLITKGDNSAYPDQEGGEPEVASNRIVGKVVTLNGNPIIFPQLGKLSSSVQGSWGKYAKSISAVCFILAAFTLWTGRHQTVRKLKSRKRWRLGDVYRIITISIVMIDMAGIYLGAQVTQIQYLVSEYPTNLKEQVEVNKPGTLKLRLKNNGLFPVWNIVSGIKPLSAESPKEALGPLASKLISINVEPQSQIGVKQAYVQLYNYPVLLPRLWLAELHRVNPIIAITVHGLVTGILFTLIFKCISYIPGLTYWIPVKALKDKVMQRRLHRLDAQLFKKRRRLP